MQATESKILKVDDLLASAIEDWNTKSEARKRYIQDNSKAYTTALRREEEQTAFVNALRLLLVPYDAPENPHDMDGFLRDSLASETKLSFVSSLTGSPTAGHIGYLQGWAASVVDATYADIAARFYTLTDRIKTHLRGQTCSLEDEETLFTAHFRLTQQLTNGFAAINADSEKSAAMYRVQDYFTQTYQTAQDTANEAREECMCIMAGTPFDRDKGLRNLLSLAYVKYLGHETVEAGGSTEASIKKLVDAERYADGRLAPPLSTDNERLCRALDGVYADKINIGQPLSDFAVLPSRPHTLAEVLRSVSSLDKGSDVKNSSLESFLARVQELAWVPAP